MEWEFGWAEARAVLLAIGIIGIVAAIRYRWWAPAHGMADSDER